MQANFDNHHLSDPEGRTSTANDTKDTCGALKDIELPSLTSHVKGAPAKAKRGGYDRAQQYAHFCRPQ